MTVDVDLTHTEQWIFNLLRHCSDQHPDAHAVRLKILLALQYSDNLVPFWEAAGEVEAYLRKAPHVSQNCRLHASEELALPHRSKNDTPVLKLRKQYLEALLAGQSTAELGGRRASVGAGGAAGAGDTLDPLPGAARGPELERA